MSRPTNPQKRAKQRTKVPAKQRRQRAKAAGAAGKPRVEMPAGALAKITPPQLRNIVERVRIFGLLDSFAEHRLIWISSPAGYGKTVAAASWLQKRRATAVWYHCDEGDADIGSFFYYFSLALDGWLGVKASLLPGLSPELHSALPTFVRNYVRKFSVQITNPGVVVFDNWQDIPSDAPLRNLLPVFINELPASIAVLIISREQPSANLGRLHSDGLLATLGVRDLQLTEAESAAIVAKRPLDCGRRALEVERQLYEASQGWAAGLTILLQSEFAPLSTRAPFKTPTQGTFNYLSSEVFDRLDESVRDFLMKTAHLNSLTVAVAREVSGNSGAQKLLDGLVHRNAFTLYRQASETYHYHPLFAQFLRTRAENQYSAAQRAELLGKAAHSLAASGDTETAVNLLLDANHFDQAAKFVLLLAPQLARQGRFRALHDWIEQLPAALSSHSGWLLYWRGIAQLVVDFHRAPTTLEHSNSLFVSERDSLGQLLAGSAILQHHLFSFNDYSKMVPWIGILESLLAQGPVFPSPSVELSVLTGLFTARVFANPVRTRIDALFDRIKALMQMDVDGINNLSSSAVLLNYCAISGYVVKSKLMLRNFKGMAAAGNASPVAHIQILWLQAYLQFICGEGVEARAHLAEALDIARHHGLLEFELRIEVARLQSLAVNQHSDEIGAGLARLEPTVTGSSMLVVGNYKYLSAMYCLATGRHSQALRDITDAYGISRDAGYILVNAQVAIGMGEILCELGRIDEAQKCLQTYQQIGADLAFPLLEFSAGLLQAEIARRRGSQAEFAAALSAALAAARSQGIVYPLHACSVTLPRLLPYALQLDIEVAHVRTIIVALALKPTAPFVEHWPWPVRIRTLGKFAIHLDGSPLRFAAKSPARPLDLLKLLVCRGGPGVDVRELEAALWPNESRGARAAFDAALLRLRKLLCNREALQLAHGMLTLNEQVCWVDAWAFERSVKHIDRSKTGDLSADILRDWGGPFLDRERETPWIIDARRRLLSMYRRLVGKLAQAKEQTADWAAAAEMYRRGLEQDPVAEELFEGLMSCEWQLGHRAEVAKVYRRCKDALSIHLGLKPSTAIETLYRRALSD